MVKRGVERLYLVLIFIFLYAPIATLVVLSFNASRSRAKWGGFTLEWYTEMFQNSSIMQALYNTLLIAFLSAAIATVLGTLGAMGISAMGFRMRSLCMSVTNMMDGENKEGGVI